MNSVQESLDRKPTFSFTTPCGYEWIFKRGLVGYDGFSSLEPWYYLAKDDVFDIAEHWPQGPHKGHLVAFARRQDCDDIACFEVEGRGVKRILVIRPD